MSAPIASAPGQAPDGQRDDTGPARSAPSGVSGPVAPAGPISSAALMAEIFRRSPAFLHVLRGPTFVFEIANEAYQRLVGRTDLIGRPAFSVLTEAAGAGFEERLARVMATREPFVGRELPVMLARTPGAPPEERLIDLTYLPLMEPDGTCERVLGYGIDVTEQVRARQAAEAERTRLLAAERRARARTEQLQQLTSAFAAATAPEAVAALVSGMAREAIGAAAGGLLLLTPDQRELELVCNEGEGWAAREDWVAPWRRFPATPGIPAVDAIHGRELLAIGSLEEFAARYPDVAPTIAAAGYGAYVVLPLEADGEVLGALNYNFVGVHEVDDEERGFLWAVARQAAQALRHTQLLAAERSARDRAEALQLLTAAFARALSVEEVVTTVVEEGRRVVGSHAGAVLLLDPAGTTFTLVAGPGITPGVAETWATFPNEGDRAVARAVRTRQPVYAHTRAEYVACDPALAPTAAALDVHAQAVVPLIVGDGAAARVLGALAFLFDAPRDFPPDDAAFLRAVADQCAQALERVRLVEGERVARAAAEAQREREAALSRSSPVGIFEADLAGRVLSVNLRLAELWEATAEEMLGLGWTARVHPEDLSALLATWREALDAGREYAREYRLLLPDGRVRLVHGRSAPRRDASGALVGAVGTIEDVTEARALEAQFRQAQKLEAVGRLAGGVAHDFNNLLTVIGGNLQFIQRELPAGSSAAQDAEEVQAAVGRATSLTRQLLAMSRRQVLRPRVLDVNASIASLGRLLQRVIGADIELRTRLEAVPALVHADPGQLEQVLMNLAVNARDAMPQGGRLELRSAWRAADRLGDVVPPRWRPPEPTPTPHGAVLVTVADTGSGMTPDTLARAFDPFFTTKAEGQGTGLGLASVQGIVAQSGGVVWIESAVDVGTAVTVALPAHAPTAVDSEVVPARTLEAAAGLVLLAEDEGSVRALAQRILEAAGYTVVAAATGREAVHQWRACTARGERVAAIVSDVVMPDRGGRHVVEAVRAVAPKLPIVLMSGYLDGAAEALPHDPATLFLEKPFTEQTLLAAVRAALARGADHETSVAR